MKFSLGKGALAEDQELVGGGGEDAGVVADEQKRGAALMAQAAEEGGEFQDAGGIQGRHVELGDGSLYRHDEKAPRITSLFTVTSYELAQQVLTDHERFSSAANAMTIGPVMGRTILEMDTPEHQRHRALVAKAFRARILDRWSDTIIGRCVGELIDEFARDGHADLIPQLTFPFPVQIGRA